MSTITRHQLVRVNVPGDDDASHPAVIVAVDEKAATVDVHVFRDGPGTQYLSALPYFPSEAAARGDLVDPATVSPSAYVVWPDAASPAALESRVNALESKLSSLQSQCSSLQSRLDTLAAAQLAPEASCVGGVIADDVTTAAAAPATA